MKKIFWAILIAALAMGIGGCSGNAKNNEKQTDKKTEALKARK